MIYAKHADNYSQAHRTQDEHAVGVCACCLLPELDGVCVLSGRWAYICRIIRTTSEEVSYQMVHVGRLGEMV